MENANQTTESIKNNILRVLRHVDQQKFYTNLVSHFHDMDFYVLRKCIMELFKKGMVQYDSKAWQINHIAVKLTPAGLQHIRVIDKHANQYKQRSWLMKLGVVSGVGFMFALSVAIISIGGGSDTGTFRADITKQEVEEAISIYFSTIDDKPQNYSFELIESEENKRIYEMNCKEDALCKLQPQKLMIQFEGDTWNITLSKDTQYP